jgi:hypothetical protein
MGQAIELISGYASAPSTTFTGLTLGTGNSLAVRSADMRSRVGLLTAWGTWQTAGVLRIRSPRLHDNQQGVRLVGHAATPSLLWPTGPFLQPLIPQDTLTVEITGSATTGDLEMASLLVYYSDLPGINARFITPEQVAAWGVNVMGQEVSLSLGTTGDYTGQVAVNSLSGCDQWKANTDYALLGGFVTASCNCIRIQGIDSGNVGVGFPGYSALPELTADFFVKLSKAYGLAAIPVFNAANKTGILVDGMQDENGADTVVTLNFVELRSPSMRQ